MASTPSTPDPVTTANAQTNSNIDSAIATADLSHTNQTNAYGDTQTWSQNGSTSYTDPSTGKTYSIPQWSETTTLSPEQQKLFDTTQSAEQGAATTANSLINQAQSQLSTPIDLSANNVNKYVNTSWEQPFQDTWNQKQSQLNQQLADQGITVGSEAYNNAQRNFGQELQNAQGTYDTSMYNTGLSALQTQYNQPINELSALLGNSQVASTAFNQNSSPTVANTDVAGITNSAYQQQLAAANATNTGLFGLGSTLMSGLFL